jgi:molybdenum cofactor guanylyltransferase
MCLYYNQTMLSVVIQAGGQSRRMGEDKGLMTFLSKPLVQRVIERVVPYAQEVIVTTNNPDAYKFLNIPLFQDLLPGQGAIGGLFTALSVARYSCVAVVACDMPFVNPNILQFAHQQIMQQGWDAVVPFTNVGYEPLHAVYRRETCVPVVRNALEAGEKRLISWFSQVRVLALTQEDLKLLDPEGLAFININTRRDLREAEKIARRVE